MHVVVAGASGLIGQAFVHSLRADGSRVTTLVRRAARSQDEVQWDPASAQLEPSALSGADAVVCLSGANVGGKRWTDSYKQTLLRSRVDTVGTIATCLARMDGDRPATFLAASAIGYYGDTGDREVDESAPAGENFLAQVCVQWENAAQPAVAAGVRVAHTRSGIVIARDADLVKRLRPIILLGAGGKLGDGQQFLSWISLRDEVRALRFLLTEELSGPVNLVAPEPVRNVDFVKTFASILHRPAVLRVPGFALRAVAGELADDALEGQRAVPAKLAGAGFDYADPTIDSALRLALQR